MAGSITVDTENEVVTLEFLDDKGNVADTPPGAQVTFTSDNEAALTVVSDPANPLQGDLQPQAEGVAHIGATIADSEGNPIMEPDGTTPFTVEPEEVTVTAGAAAETSLGLKSLELSTPDSGGEGETTGGDGGAAPGPANTPADAPADPVAPASSPEATADPPSAG